MIPVSNIRMIVARIYDDSVIEIETLFWKVHRDTCCGAAKHGHYLWRKSHVAAELVIKRVKKSLHAYFKLSPAPKRQPLIEWIVLNEVFLYRLLQREDYPVELLVVLSIGDRYQETQDEDETVDDVQIYGSDGREQALHRTRFLQGRINVADPDPVLLHAVAMTNSYRVALQ